MMAVALAANSPGTKTTSLEVPAPAPLADVTPGENRPRHAIGNEGPG